MSYRLDVFELGLSFAVFWPSFFVLLLFRILLRGSVLYFYCASHILISKSAWRAEFAAPHSPCALLLGSYFFIRSFFAIFVISFYLTFASFWLTHGSCLLHLSIQLSPSPSVWPTSFGFPILQINLHRCSPSLRRPPPASTAL